MAKYDCTKAKDFLHEAARLWQQCSKSNPNLPCGKCPFIDITSRPNCCAALSITSKDWLDLSETDFSEMASRLQKWSDSHPEKRELTENERDILKAFKALGYTYIAADKDGCVCIYVHKPQKDEGTWCYVLDDCGYVCKTEKFFGGIVSWEDEEPAKIEDLLKEVEQK